MITLDHISYTYPDATQPALRDVSLALPEGSFTLLVGASGAGKSTLLRCLNGLVPHFSGGSLAGRISVAGHDPVRAGPEVMSHHVGFVFQDPEAQAVMDRVEDEIAFALENAALPPQEMRVRVEEVLEMLDLAALRDRQLEQLSGGERQRVAIAAALALRPQLLVLDEPTSQLDPQSADDVLHALARLNNDLGLTIVLAEQRLERVLPFADRLVYLPTQGTYTSLGEPAGVLSGPPREVLAHIPLVPPLVALARERGWQPLPLTIKEGLAFSRTHQPPARRTLPTPPRTQPPLLEARGLIVAYDGRPVLNGVDLALWPGESVALLGRNGSGKTTLLRSLVGLAPLRSGHIRLAGQEITAQPVAERCRRIGYLPQDPNALLFADSVVEELTSTLRNHGLEHTAPQRVAALLELLKLAPYSQAYPRDLSTGQRQRVALGAITVTQPELLLLDEPTRGLDYDAKQVLLLLLRSWRAAGQALLLVTHDVEFAAAAAQRVILLSQGSIIADGAPASVLGSSPLFAPQVARLFPGSGWLTLEDVVP